MAHDPRRLYEGCYRRLVAQAYALTGNVDRAEKAVQSAFVRAILAARRFGHAEEPEAWLRSAALAGIYRDRRRETVSRLLRRHPEPAPPPDGPDLPVLDALRRLPPSERDAIALNGVGALPVSEIAAVSGTSLARAAQRVSRGRSSLEGAADLGGQPAGTALAVVRAAVEDTAQRPPYERLAARAKVARGRRRLGTATTVLLLVGAGLVVRVATRTEPLPVGRPVSQVLFTDRDHGFALVKPCGSGCPLRLARTVDGGKRWTPLTVPHGNARVTSAYLSVCCGNRVSVDFNGANGSGGLGQYYAVSHDSGRTWHVTARIPQFDAGRPAATHLPSGWTPVTSFDPAGPVVVATNPVDGVFRPLSHQPPLTGVDVSPPFRRGERIWVTGDDPHHRFRQKLAESVDDGDTWQVVDPPPLRRTEEVAVIYPAPDDGLYVQTKRPGDGLLRRTWRLDDLNRGVWTLLPDFGLGDAAVITTVLPDGELWLSDPTYAGWTTTDLGRRPERISLPTINGHHSKVVFAGETPDGLVYATPPPSGRKDIVFVSTDSGRHWTTRVVITKRSHVE